MEKIDFWQFTTIVTLILLVFSNYFRESQRINLIYLFLLLFFAFLIYKIGWGIYQTRKKEEIEKNIFFVFYKLSEFAMLSFIIFFISSAWLSPDKSTPSLIMLVIFLLTTFYYYTNGGFEKCPEKLKSFPAFLIGLILLFILSILLWKSDSSGNIFRFLKIFSSRIIGFLVLIFIFALVREISSSAYNKQSLCKIGWLEINKEYLSIILTVILLTFLIFLASIAPHIIANQRDYTSEKIDDCIYIKSYPISNADKLLNLYLFNVKSKNLLSVELIFKGILKRHGDYQEIIIPKETNLSHIQYYEHIFAYEFGFLNARFYDKDIYYLDALTLRVTEDTCRS